MNYLDEEKYLTFTTREEGEDLFNKAKGVVDKVKRLSKHTGAKYEKDLQEIRDRIDSLHETKVVEKPKKPHKQSYAKKVSRKDYKKKIDEYREFMREHNLNYADIITKNWYGLVGKERQDKWVKLQNFIHGRSYKLAYDPEYMFMEKVEKFIKAYKKNK